MFSCCRSSDSQYEGSTLEKIASKKREIEMPQPEPIHFTTKDNVTLRLMRIKGGKKGPIVVSPGTAMSSLSYCIKTVEINFAEFLYAEGFDIFLFDWRSSPDLASHKSSYTIAEVAKYDWPACVEQVLNITNAKKTIIFAHCLSSTALSLALLDGYVDSASIAGVVASQVFLHPILPLMQRPKAFLLLDYFIPATSMVHFATGMITKRMGDMLVTLLSPFIPQDSDCEAKPCHRMNAAMGGIILHTKINEETHQTMGNLIPCVRWEFVHDMCQIIRDGDVGVNETKAARLKIPIAFFSGEHNAMFHPDSTLCSYEYLCENNGKEMYTRTVVKDYGHLDCLIGSSSSVEVFPLFLKEINRFLE
eukprot:TRINITY_DN10630_c0_g1_i1.p1 TRINITY_DN10630_c0_g1~~TRINITY_DN10630_c0_g1_i1.p1  ORF type:complete len:362 (+),score=64.58 TRINITY_DN10630_c0_g1_i1:1281-2366(+)